MLVAKSQRALARTRRTVLCVGGGVASNARLRERLKSATLEKSVELVLADSALCSDNAAMAAMAWELIDRRGFAPLDIDVTPGLFRPKRAGST